MGGKSMTMLADKIVLVTGAGAGIGRAIALAMAEAGASIAAADIDLAAAQRTAAVAAGNNRQAIAIEADCGDVAGIDAMVARTIAELGRLDVIVNNAGVTRYAYIMDLTEADWDRIHRVNAKGVFFCLQRAAREMMRAAERGITVEELQAEQEKTIPIGRANTPEDIAAMAVFLASPGARNITGQSYNVDGGLVPS